MKFSALNRIYINQHLEKNQIINLQGEQLHYLKSVLRLKTGQNFRIFNSQDGEFVANIAAISRNNLTLKLENQLRIPAIEPNLILAMCIIKQDRMVEAIKGAVQLGVSKIIPVISERVQYRKINTERLEKIIIESAEQSERLSIPKLAEIIPLQELLKLPDIDQIIFASETEEEKNSIKNIGEFKTNLAILIGSEGGFTDQERQMIESCSHINTVSLGVNVLRAENAAIAALACTKMMRDK